MYSFTNLEKLLTTFEENQFAAIKFAIRDCKNLSKEAIHGGIQSVVLDDRTSEEPNPLPVVVAVGINYYQSSAAATYPELTHWLKTSSGSLKVGENTRMRAVTQFALKAYQRNSDEWVKARVAAKNIPAFPKYHLVAMNLSPFITRCQWSNIPTIYRNAILAAWPWRTHLDAFLKDIARVTDLWIGHGVTHVEPYFITWRQAHSLTQWMITYNLSGRGLFNMCRAQNNSSHRRHSLFKGFTQTTA